MKVDAEFPQKLQCLFNPEYSRYRVLYGGRGGAKSWGVARALLIKGAQKTLRVLCAREYMTSMKDSVHKLLSDQVMALKRTDSTKSHRTQFEAKTAQNLTLSV